MTDARLHYSFLARVGRWLSALPAALLAVLPADFDPSVLAAAVPPCLVVTPDDLVCDSALAAAFLAVLLADFDPSVLPAVAAARIPVRSLLPAAAFSLVGLASRLFARCAPRARVSSGVSLKGCMIWGARVSSATRRPSVKTATSSSLAPTAST